MRLWSRPALAGLVCLLYLALSGAAQATNYAGLVIRHGDGSVVTRCIGFDESSISGIELLYRSGLSVDAPASGYGASVYGIDGEGTAQDWSSGRASWSYWHLRGGWVFSPVGASSYSVKQGDVEGWSWGPQTSPAAPPVYTFDTLYRDAYGDPPAAAAPPAAGTTAPSATPASTPGAPGAAAPSGNAAATTGGNPPAASASGSGGPAKQGGLISTATAKAGSGTAAKQTSTSGTGRDLLVFAFLLGGLGTMFGYYYRKNRIAG